MLKYQLEKITYKNGKQGLVIVMENPNDNLVARFLMSDLQSHGASDALRIIDSVLTGETDFAEMGGNVCSLEIGIPTTVIYNDIDDSADSCEVDTSDLRQIISEWERESNPNLL